MQKPLEELETFVQIFNLMIKKLLEGMSLEGTEMGFLPTSELLSHRIINCEHRKKKTQNLRGYSLSSASFPEKISLQYFISTVSFSNELPVIYICQPTNQPTHKYFLIF